MDCAEPARLRTGIGYFGQSLHTRTAELFFSQTIETNNTRLWVLISVAEVPLFWAAPDVP